MDEETHFIRASLSLFNNPHSFNASAHRNDFVSVYFKMLRGCVSVSVPNESSWNIRFCFSWPKLSGICGSGDKSMCAGEGNERLTMLQ